MVKEEKSCLGVCQFGAPTFLNLPYSEGTTDIVGKHQINRGYDNITCFGIYPGLVAQYLLSNRFTH